MVRIGILVFPRVQQLDLTGPYEVFSALPDAKVDLVWKDRDAVVSSSGLSFVPTATYLDCPPLDVLCIPGGDGVNALMQDETTLAFVRRQAERVRYLTSVCTGSLVLGAAGLLKGRRAATYWAAYDFLEGLGAIPVRERVVRDGNLITGGGVTAGIDFALTLVAELAGRERAELIQLGLEYAPQPPFAAGDPATAPSAVVDAFLRRAEAALQTRQRVVADIRAKNGDA